MITPETSKSFCWYPFFQVAMKVFDENSEIAEIAPCCNAIQPPWNDPMQLNGKTHNKSPVQIFEGEEFKRLRSDLLQGIRNPICETCWLIEDEGRTSYRRFSRPKQYTDEELQPLIEKPQLLSVETTSSLRCNLRCRMCNPGSSHKLDIERQAFVADSVDAELLDLTGLNWTTPTETNGFHKNNYQLKWLLENPQQLRMLKIAGGEPMYDPDFIAYLTEYTREENHTTLTMHTNATQFNSRAMTLLNSFESIDMTFSIDSFGRNYEYIRHPMTWAGLEKSVDNFLEQITVPYNVDLNVVVQASNLLHLHELIQWAIPRGFSIQFSDLNPKGRAADPVFLPVSILEEVKIRLQSVKLPNEWSIKVPKLLQDIQFWIDNNKADERSRRRMLREHQLFDKVKQQDYKDYLDPLLVEYLNAGK